MKANEALNKIEEISGGAPLEFLSGHKVETLDFDDRWPNGKVVGHLVPVAASQQIAGALRVIYSISHNAERQLYLKTWIVLSMWAVAMIGGFVLGKVL